MCKPSLHTVLHCSPGFTKTFSILTLHPMTTSTSTPAPHSIASCIRIAHKTFTSGLRPLIKRMALPGVFMAALLTFAYYVQLPNASIVSYSHEHFITVFASAIILLLLLFATETWVIHALLKPWSPLRGGKRFFSTMVCLLINGLFILPCAGLYYVVCTLLPTVLEKSMGATGTLITVAIALLVVTVLAIVLFLPLMHAVHSVCISDKPDFATRFARAYRDGLHHFLLLFTGGVVIVLLPIIAAVPLMVPCLILTTAHISNELGMLNGDPNGLPPYFLPLFTVVIFITMTLLLLVFAWAVHVWHRISLSVTAREALRNEQSSGENHETETPVSEAH